MITTIPLSKLRLSSANVRKTGERNIEQLAASILALGILSSVRVSPMKKPKGHYEIIAGSRRFQALTLLAATGKIDADYPVPATEKAGTDAELTEVSLAENFQRMAMTAADECRAFQHSIAQGDDLDAVATRWGVTRRFVEGRLRLANLAPPIFDALADGTLTLDKAKAYASTDSHEKQLRVFENYGTQSYYNADAIKRAIQVETMRATDAIALLVGEEAYVAAGGHVTRDLFEIDGDRWNDPEIAERIATEMMTAEAKRIGNETGLAWIRPVGSTNIYSEASSLYRVTVPMRPTTAEEDVAIAQITERFGAIETEMENESLSDETCTALEAEMDDLRARYGDLTNRPTELPDDLKSNVGAFLTLTHKGKLVLDSGFYSETPLQDDNDDGRSITTGGTVRPAPKTDETVPGGKPLSAKLSDSLAVQRRDVLAAALLAQPGLALDYALFVLVDTGHATYGTTIEKRRPNDPVAARDVPASRARDYLGEVQSELDSSWTEHTREVDRFDAFRALEDDAKAAWLAMSVATSLEAKPGYASSVNPLQGRLAELLEIDVAAWWRPNSENFFDRVSKATLLAILGDIGGPGLAGRYATSKKGEVSASCTTLFAGQAISEPEVKEKALAWLPAAMTFTAGATANAAATGDDVIDDADADFENEAEAEPGNDRVNEHGAGTIEELEDDELDVEA